MKALLVCGVPVICSISLESLAVEHALRTACEPTTLSTHAKSCSSLHSCSSNSRTQCAWDPCANHPPPNHTTSRWHLYHFTQLAKDLNRHPKA
eukprot:1234415-Pleurochrysis_carterae.AAC.7